MDPPTIGRSALEPDKIVRELLHEIKQLSEGSALDLHRCVVCVEHNAVLVVVNVRRILEEPVALVDGHRNDAVVLAGGMIHTACITFIFTAQQAFRITGLFCQLRCSNSLGILLRLGQVDSNVQIAVFGGCYPFHILADTITADIVGISA